jgi:hypothetical protein
VKHIVVIGRLRAALALVALAISNNTLAQTVPATRPLPLPVELPPAFQRAIEAGTRTRTGEAGPRYWQQSASYRLVARVLTEAKRLEGSATIVYRNNSPDTLANLHIDLTQNFHRGDVIRNEPAEVTGGVQLQRVAVAGRELNATATSGPRYQVFGTRLIILPPQPVLPGSTIELHIDWSFSIPRAGGGERMGWDRDNLFFLAYWYPQMVVYDDIAGWHPDPFVGTTEFYSGFGSYDLTVEGPAGWLVMATGDLVNAQEVLAPTVYQRLRQAESSDQVVNVITAQDFGKATQAGNNGQLRWRFVSDSVRDVAFSVTRESLWDAARTSVGDRNGDGRPDFARVDAIYRSTAPRWRQSARYSQHSIRFLSQYLGVPYPWPHMTAIEAGGIIGGGMEFPMMTLIGDYNQRGDTALYAVTAHEEGHMWFPMLVSSDERRYSWMDEGTTTFNENQAKKDYYPGRNWDLPEQEGYLSIVRAGEEGEIMRRSAYHYSGAAYGIASYDKPATMLASLRAVLGNDVFERALREYARRWKYKHPTAWDMWNTFEHVSGRDLDWFWYPWYHTTWALDQAVASVRSSASGSTITVEDRGKVPMPVHLVITLAGGQVEKRTIPVDVWLSGATSTTVNVASAVSRVAIDPDRLFPDVNRANNVWTSTNRDERK